MNVVKMVHQKRSNKHGQTVDELKMRKRMEVLTEAKKEATILQMKTTGNWNQGILDVMQSKSLESNSNENPPMKKI